MGRAVVTQVTDTYTGKLITDELAVIRKVVTITHEGGENDQYAVYMSASTEAKFEQALSGLVGDEEPSAKGEDYPVVGGRTPMPKVSPRTGSADGLTKDERLSVRAWNLLNRGNRIAPLGRVPLKAIESWKGAGSPMMSPDEIGEYRARAQEGFKE